MKVDKDKLQKVLSVVNKVVAPKSTLPILSNVLFADDYVAATNLDVGIGCKFDSDINTTIPAKLLTELVRSFGGDEIEMIHNEATEETDVICGNTKTVIKCVSSVEYPSVQPGSSWYNDATSLSINTDVLVKSIKQVVIVSATDISRPILTGVYIDISGNVLTMAAADGYRLSVKTETTNDSEAITVIVPAESLKIVAQVAQGKTCNIHTRHNQIMFDFGDVWVISQVLEGNFPDYKQIIPEETSATTEVNRIEFTNALKVAKLFSTTNIVILDIKEGKMKINSSASDVGHQETVLDVETNGEPVRIAFNVVYLLDGLDLWGDETITLSTGASNAPGVLSNGKDDLIYVLMPMRISK